jgi:hypothetical protein
MNSLLSDDEVEKILFQQAKKEKRKGFELGFFTLEENPVYRSYVEIGIRPLYIFYLMNPNIYIYIYIYIYTHTHRRWNDVTCPNRKLVLHEPLINLFAN